MKEYTKIETLYNRDVKGTKRMIDGDFRNETVEFLKDNQWVFTEKIDGTNIGIAWDGHKVSYQGRTEKAQIPLNLMNELIIIFGGEENEELFEQKFGDMHVILFGEGYGAKIQKGGEKYSEKPSFILFDVYLPESDLWLKRDSLEDIAKCFSVPVVPIVLTGTIQQGVDYVKSHPLSSIAVQERYMEGIVGRPAVDVLDRQGKRVIVKIKWNDVRPVGKAKI